MGEFVSVQGDMTGEDGAEIILLPAGPIRSTVVGESGEAYEQVLYDDPLLGRPTERLEPADVVYQHP